LNERNIVKFLKNHEKTKMIEINVTQPREKINKIGDKYRNMNSEANSQNAKNDRNVILIKI
jgi:hypothetical protein